jgi:hypothetical protein
MSDCRLAEQVTLVCEILIEIRTRQLVKFLLFCPGAGSLRYVLTRLRTGECRAGV